MDRKLKSWELALMFGVLVVLAGGSWLGDEQKNLAESVIRLHVIANSNSPEDQALKLAVRDEVLAEAEAFYPEHATLEQAREVLEEHLDDLAQAGQTVVEKQGYNYTVEAQLTNTWFPTKEYDGFAFPAGNYNALRVVIGDGAGKNWWCVAFPPLCLGAASQTVEEAAQAGCFTPDQAALITEQDEGYILKFKSMELLGQLQGIFSH